MIIASCLAPALAAVISAFLFEDRGAIAGIASWVYVIVMAVVGTWGLRQKGRSLWWLFMVIPFGWIPYVCLKNRAASKYDHTEGHIG